MITELDESTKFISFLYFVIMRVPKQNQWGFTPVKWAYSSYEEALAMKKRQQKSFQECEVELITYMPMLQEKPKPIASEELMEFVENLPSAKVKKVRTSKKLKEVLQAEAAL